LSLFGGICLKERFFIGTLFDSCSTLLLLCSWFVIPFSEQESNKSRTRVYSNRKVSRRPLYDNTRQSMTIADKCDLDY
jgi:hypothetical protein